MIPVTDNELKPQMNERYLLKTFMNFCRFNKYPDHMYYVTSK